MSARQPVILCGGSGTRLWPASRRERPKPFLPLIGDQSLFEQTVARLAAWHAAARPMVVTGRDHTGHVREQAADAALIVEPVGRNTAPAIALAALRLAPDTVMLVCPSDHFIADVPAFAAAADKACALAEQGLLVSIGIAPDHPATGYGYIEMGEALGEGRKTARFVEKPDLARAQGFLASGDFVWNAGIFAFRAGTFLEELALHRPAMTAGVRQAAERGADRPDGFHPDGDAFTALPSESVDYALMENTDRAAVVPADMGWSDIGDWNALMTARAAQADGAGNIAAGADLVDCRGVMVQSDGPRVSVVGLDDLVVVVDGNEVLVVRRDAAQKVGTLPGTRG